MVFPDKIFAVDLHKLPSTHKGVNSAALKIGNTSTTTVKDLAESPKVALTWHTSKHKVYKLHQRHIVKCTSVIHACQVKLDRFNVSGDSGLCCCTPVTYFGAGRAQWLERRTRD